MKLKFERIRNEMILDQMDVWGCIHNGFSYVITKDNMHPHLGYTATAKRQVALIGFASLTIELGKTFEHPSLEAAAEACYQHATGTLAGIVRGKK